MAVSPSCGWLCAYSGGKAIIHGQTLQSHQATRGRPLSAPHEANVTPNMYSALAALSGAEWPGSWRGIMRQRQRMSFVKE